MSVEGHSFSVRPMAANRAARSVVGRQLELETIETAVDAALESLVGICLEGEPGIGKTTLLNAAADMCIGRGLMPVIVAADEEIRGPLLTARAIFDSDELRAGRSDETAAAIERARNGLRGSDDSGLATMPADERLLRAFDLCSIALMGIAREKPVALMIDDLQWADADSIRLLRYVIRANSAAPMYLMFTVRPEETAQVTEIVNLLADLERIGILRRLQVERLRQTETAQMLKSILGGEAAPATAATIHAQAEGVPFIIQELTRTYREAGLLQNVGGTWSLGRHAERLVPSAVRTLIQRRAAALPPDTRQALATGAVLGRDFRVDDICALQMQRREATDCQPEQMFELLRPALAAGLISEVGEETSRHLRFSHEQVRTFALEALSPSQRRSMHTSIVEMLTADGNPGSEALPIVVRHAVAAGDGDLIARYSLDAARGALAANAPEEALRLVDEALAFVAHPAQRVQLLCARDDALFALGRTAERVEAITELSALVEAVGDPTAELDVNIRRAAALRGDKRYEAAADLARRVQAKAVAEADKAAELAASMELGQGLMRSPLGEGYIPSNKESDLDGAEVAFERALALAVETGSELREAQALRELAAIKLARIRAWFVERVRLLEHLPIVIRLANGESKQDIERELPIYGETVEAEKQLTRALEIFEKLGDRRGAMSAIVSLAYLNWGPELHLGTNPAQRFEGIRQLSTAMATLAQGSGREASDVQMLYGAHVFARSKVIPDLAIERGQQAFDRSRAIGDSGLEFLSAIGLARVFLDAGDIDQAQRWLERAADRAAASPTPHRARQVAICSALIAGERGDSDALVSGLREIARAAASQRRPAAQCEALALLALEAARHGAAADDSNLLDVAVAAAQEARRLAEQLPGRPPWSLQADAAESRVALVRGDRDTALRLARKALNDLHSAEREDPHLEILLPAARVIQTLGEPEEKQQVTAEVRFIQAVGVSRIMDEQIRISWFRGPLGRELAELAGPVEQPAPRPTAEPVVSSETDLDERQSRLLQLLVEGRSNREIGEELALDDAGVSGLLSALYARIGTTSRAETTAFAFRAV